MVTVDLQTNPAEVPTFIVAPGGLRGRRKRPPGRRDRGIDGVSLGKQDRQVVRVKGERWGILRRPPGKPTFGKPFCAQPKAAPIKDQDLNSIFGTVCKNENGSAKRVFI
jgi:hypothetical protein